MAGSYLLDTNVAVELLRGDDVLWQRLEKETSIAMTVVVLGELYYGACKSDRVDKNLEKVDRLAARTTVLVSDRETAFEYGRIKNELRARGKLIPENDMWIAAAARQHGLTLVTRDPHFENVQGLDREVW